MEDGFSDPVEVAVTRCILETAHGRLRAERVIRRQSTATDLEYIIAAQVVAIVRILVTGSNLKDALGKHLLERVRDVGRMAGIDQTAADGIDDSCVRFGLPQQQ